MPTYSLRFYDLAPVANGFLNAASGTFTYTGPSEPPGTITITDNESGIQGQTLDDDNNGAETATGTATINGNTSVASDVDAEKSWLIRDDVTLDVFNVVELEIESGPAVGYYTLSEMRLLSGRSYTILDYNTNPDVLNGDPVLTYSEYICFATGTQIATPTGTRRVETLRPGDLVLTRDNGAQPLVWVGARSLTFAPGADAHKPVEFKPGSLGANLPASPLILSPQHRVLLQTTGKGSRSPPGAAFGPAKSLCGRRGIRRMIGKRSVCYHSLMTPRHEVLFANGLSVESFYPGQEGLRLLSWIDRLRLGALFPGILTDARAAYGPPAHPFLKARQVREMGHARGLGPDAVKRPGSAARYQRPHETCAQPARIPTGP